jgi:Fic family protein
MSGTVDRTYLRTHPWLSFHVDLRQAPTELWMLLGEARSKVQHLGESLLAPETGERLRQVYLAKGVHATTAIEGNTLSEEEVAEHLAGRLELPASQAYRTREIDNIVTAYNHIADELFGDESGELTPEKIREYNRLILDELPLEEGVVPGEMASRPPVVGRYRAPPREDCDYLLEQLCRWLNSEGFTAPNDELVLPYAVIKAVLAHLYLAWIHYFGDGNGRTARCVELQIMLATGRVSTPAAHLLSNHYNITRDEYYRQLGAASRDGDGSPIAFLVYAVRGFVDQLRAQLHSVWEQLCADRWEQYIYQQFGDARTPPHIRQRQLVLDLSKQAEPVPRTSLRDLSPKVASAYAKRGEKTLTRDLNALVNRDLIVLEAGGYRPRREKILSLLASVPQMP